MVNKRKSINSTPKSLASLYLTSISGREGTLVPYDGDLSEIDMESK